MRAAVEAVDGDAPAPAELRLAWECERWRCLPETGAYMDQDYSLLTRMSVLSNVYSAYSRYRNAHGAQIHQLTEGERRILRNLKDNGLIFQG
jgi:ABC-type phosphate/phosphonate transport system ATPase subunit